jgi:hypothetical protein
MILDLDLDFLDLWIFLGFGFPIQIQFKKPFIFRSNICLYPHACLLIMIFTVRSRAWEIKN